MEQRLKAAAEAGNINALFALIKEDAGHLKRIDEVLFIDTPLHIAASRGHTDFSMEMVTLMPSYARKLNPDGYSPLHLALQNGKTDLVLCLIKHDKDLIRVKGRKGKTLLHYLVAQENQDVILTKFLVAYPDCIQDVTSKGHTALHIALKKRKFEAFKVLVGWLRRSTHKDAEYLEDLILNWRDYRGNSLLHLAALKHQVGAVRLLLDCQLEGVHTKNMDNQTALDIAKNSNDREIMKMLPKHREYKLRHGNLTDYLKSRIPIRKKLFIPIVRGIEKISNDNQTRDALLVVFVLVATAIYEVALSPPAGLWQGQPDNNSVLPSLFHDSIHTKAAPAPATLGKTIMDTNSFTVIVSLNSFALFLTLSVIVFLFPIGLRRLLVLPLLLMYGCYALSMQVISPPADYYPIGGPSFLQWINLRFGYFLLFLLFITGPWCMLLMFITERKRRKFKHEWGTSLII